MGIIFKTSSLRNIPRKKSVMSDSLMGREKRWISSRDSVFISCTRWLSLVMEIHTLALAPQKLSWPPILGPLGLPRCLTALVSSIVLSFLGEEKCKFL